MSKPVIVTATDGYYLKVGSEESDVVPFGEPLEVELGGERWLCMVDLPEGADEAAETESVLDSWLYKVVPMAETEFEFEEDDDEDADGEEPVEITVPDDDQDDDGDDD